MIIFDLDGTLSDCEHRRHFIDPTLSVNHILQGYDGEGKMIDEKSVYCNIIDGKRFKPDWKSFYEACDKDKPIYPVIEMMDGIFFNSASSRHFYENVEIWSGRCESVRGKTLEWLGENTLFGGISNEIKLKMRPIGDNTPDNILKEKWLDEYISSMYPKLPEPTNENKKQIFTRKYPIQFVFESDTKSIQMWRRRGIFVFDVNQSGEEF